MAQNLALYKVFHVYLCGSSFVIAAYPPEPSDPTLTAEAPPSYNLAANYPAPPTYTDQNP